MLRSGKTFIVTGGGSGLGQATVERLYAEGANIGIFDRDVPNDIPYDAKRVIFLKVDVTDEFSVQQGVKTVATTFGGIHGVVNCAGVGGATTTLGRKGPHSLDKFDFVMKVNLYGSFNVARFAVEYMAKQPEEDTGGRGVIINTASVAAFDGQKGQVAYAASKGALVSMALPMARDLARYGIRVMTIAPGIFGTPMLLAMPDKVKESLLKDVVSPRRFGLPSEFAQCVSNIIDNHMLNAHTIRLDAGIRMSNL